MPHTIMFFFFFNDTATTEIYTLSLHDALPISCSRDLPLSLTVTASQAAGTAGVGPPPAVSAASPAPDTSPRQDRKSTRLNSSHANISYAVFCLKKKKHSTRTATTHTTRHIMST